MGFFDKLKAGLTKSRSNVGEGVNTIFSTYDKIDDESLIDSLNNIDEINESYKEKYELFYNKYCNIGHGNASEEIIKAIFDNGGLK